MAGARIPASAASARSTRSSDSCCARARSSPILLIFESLHWVDSETQAFLDSLVDSLPTARALLLVSYRPEYQHNWGSKTYYTQFRIDPLPPASAEEFLARAARRRPGLRLLKQILIDRTEGNPFFLEECVRTLVETQDAHRRARSVPCRPGGPGASRCPRPSRRCWRRASIGCPMDARRLLQAAAVIGMDVPLNLLDADHGRARRTCSAAGLTPAAVRGVPVRGEPLPDRGVHVQARAHAGRRLQHAAPGAPARAPRPHRGGHRAPACRPAGRARGAPRPSRAARGGLGQGRRRTCVRPGAKAAARAANREAVILLRAGAGRRAALARGTRV